MPLRRIAEMVLESATDYAIITTNLSGHITYWSRGAEVVLGWHSSEIVDQHIEKIFTPEDRAHGIAQKEMSNALTFGRGNDERWHLKRDGSRFWASGEVLPLRQDGQAEGFLKILRDRTPQKRAEEELRASEAQLQLAQKAGGVGTFAVDLDSGELTGSSQFFQIFGLPETGASIGDVEATILAEDAHLASSSITRTAGLDAGSTEYRIRRTDTGEMRWVNRRSAYSYSEAGKLLRLQGTVQDITDRRKAQEFQTLLTGELAHRMKNQLALVQAIVNQTVRSATDIDVLGKTINDRILVLSKAHDLILNGATQATIGEIITSATQLHDDRLASRFQTSGPELAVGSRPALSLSLILHELATNAVKYGALSSPSGSVSIDWETRSNESTLEVILTWQEHGGPLVSRPSSSGAGSRLIRAGLAGAVNSTVNIEYAPKGVRCIISAELSSFQAER
jgi:PAS domain S-box-containing protein